MYGVIHSHLQKQDKSVTLLIGHVYRPGLQAVNEKYGK